MPPRVDRPTAIGFGVVALAAFAYWFASAGFEAGRGDFFYLAEAFLQGRTWLDFLPGPFDVILGDAGQVFVPFAPFPAIALMPLVAVTGAEVADQWESGINAVLAASTVGMAWWFAGRAGVQSVRSRLWLVALFGFSTQILWVTTRGGVWHTGHLIATLLTFGCLIELWGSRRAWLIGLMAGAAFLTRAPLAFAVPFYALLLLPEDTWTVRLRETAARALARVPWRSWAALAAGLLPAIGFFFLYNQLRFGDPLESGYGLATLPPWLEAQREQGLFSLAHVPMNIDYLFLHFYIPTDDFPYFTADGLGLSVFVTSPGLLYAVRADWRRPVPWLLLGTAALVLVPTLLYYGGGWYQYGYRYFLDSIPFIWAICAIAAAQRGRIGWGWRGLIAAGIAVMAYGVYFAYHPPA